MKPFLLLPTLMFLLNINIQGQVQPSVGTPQWMKTVMNETTRLLQGKALFKANCASCHKPDKDFTGPTLAGATSRYSREWLYRFIRNPAAMVETDPIAKALFKKWKPTVMTGFNLSRSSIDAILTYADYQAQINKQRKSPETISCYF